MTVYDVLAAALLGVVEGITEFLPISSTGHLILFIDLMGFKGPPGRIFEVVIQLGAIVGVCWVYWERISGVIREPLKQKNLRFLAILGIGFLPSALIGVFAHNFIKTILFNPMIVSISLVTGGIVIIAVERLSLQSDVDCLEDVSVGHSFKIGLCQTLAMIPGVSRSGASILGGMIFGLDRKTAAEYSFLLAIPTMFAATGYDLYLNSEFLEFNDVILVAVGFLTALASAICSVRWLVSFVSRHPFALFGWYRIAVGVIMITWLVSSGNPLHT